MFHAPTSENKQQNDSGRSRLAADQGVELSPRSPVISGHPLPRAAGYGAPHASPLRSAQQHVARLHSMYGNQAILRMLSPAPSTIQTKLTVNQPGDPFEQEADRVADQVTRMPAPPSVQRKCSSCAAEDKVQRKCAECAEEEKKTELHRKETNARPQFAPPSVHNVLNSPGQPLDPATRSFMEPRFGHDFSSVRLHTDAQAADSATAVNALAYTSGRHIVFGAAQHNPGSDAGRHLLAHELAHLVQQGSSKAPPAVQRDLATEPPAVPAPAQPDLTPAEITEAINFNSGRYDEANTRLIQDLLGGPITGTWTEENIVAIASTQEEYGLHKDGKVGNHTFRFLDREQRLEGMSTKTEDCLTSFLLVGPDPVAFGRDDATHCHFSGHHRMEAQFSPRCNCDQFQYRQFVRGHLHRTRGGAVTDLPVRLPGGVLTEPFQEDADVADPVPNYGHRDQAAEANPENHYIDAAGNDDQAHGCRYRGEDTLGGTFGDCLAGDRYDLSMRFRGEIRRNGAPIQSKFWTDVNVVNWNP